MSAVVVVLAACAILAPAAAQASWSVPSGTVPTNTSELSGVSCLSASACLLVGFQSGTTTSALGASWDGSAFSALTMASTTSELYDGTCNATVCFAVGTDYASGAVPHAESFDGTSWTTTSTPTPSGSTFAALEGVACPAGSVCFAAGWYETSTADLPMIERWNGTSWSLQTLTLPANTTNAKLLDVSCASASACTAVGYFEATGAPRRTFVETWDGTSWAPQTSANPSGANLGLLEGVECASASQCTAVGEYIDGSSVQHPLAEAWDGTSWSLETVPDPTGDVPNLEDVSCVTSPSYACTAVGEYTASSHYEPLAAGWNGSAWSLQSVPKPAGVSDAVLFGVSCPTTCMAVGASVYDGTTGVTGLRPLVELGP